MAIIDKPSDYFNTKLYTGNGSTQSFTGVGFQPDLIWVKSRSNTEPHIWTDVVRGANKNIRSNATSSEFTDANNITSFDSDGFSVGTGGAVNENTYTFASWNWKAGGTASSNTDGSITSSVSANQDAGFSIVSYTGTGSSTTVGHGLGVAPAMMICKSRTSSSAYWYVYHKNLGNAQEIYPNVTNAAASSATWNSTSPTSSVFSIGSHVGINESGSGHIAYCFAEKQGYSKFGSYTGNGNADGTFVYTGFKPAWFLVKQTNESRSWYIWDNKRDSDGNPMEEFLSPNNSNAESGSGNDYADFTSNGIKMRENNAGFNKSGGTYIYMCFASNPFVSSTGVPATAR